MLDCERCPLTSITTWGFQNNAVAYQPPSIVEDAAIELSSRHPTRSRSLRVAWMVNIGAASCLTPPMAAELVERYSNRSVSRRAIPSSRSKGRGAC